MKDPKFKIGDKVTYKDRDICIYDDGNIGNYYWHGTDQGGFVGTIKNIVCYIEEKECWKLYVTTSFDGEYSMLESEFLEYDEQTNDLFPIYQNIMVLGKSITHITRPRLNDDVVWGQVFQSIGNIIMGNVADNVTIKLLNTMIVSYDTRNMI